jgi:hypothetical protein
VKFAKLKTSRGRDRTRKQFIDKRTKKIFDNFAKGDSARIVNEVTNSTKYTGSKINCVRGNCYTGQGIWLENSGYSYVGQFKDGKKHGQGVDRKGGHDKYRIFNGSFKDNLYNGAGVLHIQNGKDNPYIFGAFKDGNLEDGTDVLMKFASGVDAYYKVTTKNNGNSTLKLIEEKTAQLFCEQNPTKMICVREFVWKNKKSIFNLFKIGYLGVVINRNKRISFNDIYNGITLLADTMNNIQGERPQEFADRVARTLKLPND